MKKQLLTKLSVAFIFGSAYFGCTVDSDSEEDSCICEKVTYIEAKYQEQSTQEWLLNYSEVLREPVQCQNETNYSVPPTGSELREVHRIECN